MLLELITGQFDLVTCQLKLGQNKINIIMTSQLHRPISFSGLNEDCLPP
jgi:hypothetical protein